MKESTAIINYENMQLDIICQNPQQLSTTVNVLGRLKGLKKEFNRITNGLQGNIVDCGANVGAYSIMLHYCFPEAGVVAIEPSSYNIPYLTHNCKIIPDVDIRQIAVGDKIGRGRLALPTMDQKEMYNDYLDEHTGVLSLYGNSDNLAEDVDIYPLDELDLKRPIGFIKIDTEGYDLNVLKGATNILVEDKPCILIEIFERNLVMAGIKSRDIFRILAGHGYFPFFIYGKDYFFKYVGVDYLLDKLDYKFMEATQKGWAG